MSEKRVVGGEGKEMKKIKGFKAFNKDMTCKGFQYQEGKTYKTKEVRICNEGFHFCENPLDCLSYYDLCESVFHEVESTGKTDKSKDESKIVTTEIKIGARLDLKGFIRASIDFVFSKCFFKSSGDYATQASSGYSAQQASSGNYAKQASSGDSAKQASSGDSAKQASSGDSAKQASSGDYATQASSGDYATQASSGYSAQQASSGYYAQQASSGYSAQQASSGDYAKQASSGDSAKQASSGYSAQSEIKGKYSVSASIGKDSKIKGKKGNWITLAEWIWDKEKQKHIPLCVKSAQIDGKKIKENTWYKLENKKFVEVD